MLKKLLLSTLKKNGRQISPYPNVPPDISEVELIIIKSVSAFTYTSPERIYALIQSVKYLVTNKIEGNLLECGV